MSVVLDDEDTLSETRDYQRIHSLPEGIFAEAPHSRFG